MTSNRRRGIIGGGVQGLWKKGAALIQNTTTHNNNHHHADVDNDNDDNTTSNNNNYKSIALHWVDRIDRGSMMNSPRLLQMEQANFPGLVDATQRQAVQRYILADQCLSMVYYAPNNTNGTASEHGSNNNTNGKLVCLDLIVPNAKEFHMLLTTAQELLYLARKELQQYTAHRQALHFHWMGLDKDWNSRMALFEFHALVQVLFGASAAVTKKKAWLTTLFKEECAKQPNNNNNKNSTKKNNTNDNNNNPVKLLSMSAIARLIPVVAQAIASGSSTLATTKPVDPPLQKLWNKLVETDPVPIVGLENNDDGDDPSTVVVEVGILKERQQPESISAVALLSFIRSQQKNYTATLEQITVFVQELNAQISEEEEHSVTHPSGINHQQHPFELDRLTKARFMSWLTSDANDIVDPESAKIGADDMNQPLSHYWISTSHDTYVGKVPEAFAGRLVPNGPQALDLDAHQYTAALLRGVRCLELDVWDDEVTKEPVVALLSNSKSISLRLVLESIRYFLNQNPYTFPVILKMENRCSTEYQLKMANMFYEYFGAANLIVKPSENEKLSSSTVLPSPASTRGMIIILGKRPKTVKVGCTFINDDLDFDGWQMVDPTVAVRLAALADVDDEKRERQGRVIGFDSNGPVYSTESDAVKRSATDLLTMAMVEYDRAIADSKTAELHKNDVLQRADAQEQLTAQLTQDAGMWPEEVKRRAAEAASQVNKVGNISAEEKNSKDEGLEIHEILPGVVEGNQDSYAEAVRQAMEAEQIVTARQADMRAAELALERAESDLVMSRQLELNGVESAKKAASEARIHQEHAAVALERVEQVKALCRISEESASSAGTVVQTAVTEAKISEKRAIDAEVRAERARAAADKDRLRSEDETKIEEAMEQEVNDLHITCQDATEASQSARVRLDKANAMFERVSEQIKLIENSSQYRKELAQMNADVSSVRHGGSFLAKHETKIVERSTCRELIKEALEERSVAETRLIMLKTKFEERARAWRTQANTAAQFRRTADRSLHLAEELAEHAEEEREAAKLRQVARERAVETVENRGSLKESVVAQLAEAERAAVEATVNATQSRSRANRLAKEIDKIADHSTFIQNVTKRRSDLEQTSAACDSATAEKIVKYKIVEEEKRRLDTNAFAYNAAARDAATEGNRVKAIEVLQQDAIIAYNTAIMLRKQVVDAVTMASKATTLAESKRVGVEHAREFKEQTNLLIDMPVLLAKLTLLHSERFLNWDRSLVSTPSCVNSFAQNFLLEMFEAEPESASLYLHAYTRDHLCRVYPPWRQVTSKILSNYDPVFSWSLGCQLVAMNFQTAHENLLVADGRFRQNGSSGYVLKPRQLTEKSTTSEQHQSWTFSILGGCNLPRTGRKPINAQVAVSLHSGSTSDSQKFKTKPSGGYGSNPSWANGEDFSFTITNPSIAMFTFSVWDVQEKTEHFIAGASVPVSCLREGYRSVALYSVNHARTGLLRYSVLLIKANKR